MKLVQIILIKSRRMRGKEHVAYKEKGGSAYRVLVGKPEGRDHLENLGVDGNVELNGSSRSGLGGGDMGWVGGVWDDRWRALVNAVTNLRVP